MTEHSMSGAQQLTAYGAFLLATVATAIVANILIFVPGQLAKSRMMEIAIALSVLAIVTSFPWFAGRWSIKA